MQADGTMCIPLVVRSLSCSPTSGSLDLHFNATISLTVHQHTQIFLHEMATIWQDLENFGISNHLSTFSEKEGNLYTEGYWWKGCYIIQYHWFKKRQVYKKRSKKTCTTDTPLPRWLPPAFFPEEKPPRCQDFTSISEELKQDDLILLLTVYLSVMTRIIELGISVSPWKNEWGNSCKPTIGPKVLI